MSSLRTLATKHLSYYSPYYFQMMMKFTQINVRLVQRVINHVREQVSRVEEIRCAGPDAKLR